MNGGQTQGISIRFPRFTKARPDKTWKEATSVPELERLVAHSGQRSDWLDILNDAAGVDSTEASQPTDESPRKQGIKRAQSPGANSVRSDHQVLMDVSLMDYLQTFSNFVMVP